MILASVIPLYVLKTKKRYIITTRARLLNNTPDTKNKALEAPDSFSILGVLGVETVPGSYIFNSFLKSLKDKGGIADLLLQLTADLFAAHFCFRRWSLAKHGNGFRNTLRRFAGQIHDGGTNNV